MSDALTTELKRGGGLVVSYVTFAMLILTYILHAARVSIVESVNCDYKKRDGTFYARCSDAVS